jgi:hypothetical protein
VEGVGDHLIAVVEVRVEPDGEPAVAARVVPRSLQQQPHGGVGLLLGREAGPQRLQQRRGVPVDARLRRAEVTADDGEEAADLLVPHRLDHARLQRVAPLGPLGCPPPVDHAGELGERVELGVEAGVEEDVGNRLVHQTVGAGLRQLAHHQVALG